MSKPGSIHSLRWVTERALAVCVHLGVGWSDFCSKSRDPKVIKARRAAVYLLRTCPGPGNTIPSFPEIAISLGRNADGHASYIGMYSAALQDPEVQEAARQVAAKLNQPMPKADELTVAEVTGLLEWLIGEQRSDFAIRQKAREMLLRLNARTANQRQAPATGRTDAA